MSNLLIDTKKANQLFKNMTTNNPIKKMIYKIKKHLQYNTSPALVKMYGDQSTPIPIETYKNGLISLYSKVNDPKRAEEIVDNQMKISKINSISTFNPKANNAFSSAFSQSERKEVNTNLSGPSATQ